MISVPHFYAKVLFEMDSQRANELCDLKEGLSQNVILFFNSPFISFKEKKKVIEKLPLSDTLKGFLYQITLKRRWKFFFDICKQYFSLLDEKKNIMRGVIYSAKSLALLEKEKTEQALDDFFKNKTVILKNEVKPSLINGIKIVIEGYCFDDTVSQHLKRFRAQVLEQIQ